MNGCVHQTEDERCELFSNGKYQSWCVGKEAPCGYRRPSNGDKVRAMSDEELADWFIIIQDDVADYCDKGHSIAPELPTLRETWVEWLKQEAD